MNNRLDHEIFRLEKEEVVSIPIESIIELFSILKHIDQDLAPLLDIVFRLIDNVDDEKLRAITMVKLLKFYGIENADILSARQKFVVEEGHLVKKPFLKKSQRENIEVLMSQLGIEIK